MSLVYDYLIRTEKEVDSRKDKQSKATSVKIRAEPEILGPLGCVYVKIFFYKFGDLKFIFGGLFVCNFFQKLWGLVANVSPSMAQGRPW